MNRVNLSLIQELGKCNCCGNKPDELEESMRPRIAPVEAFGKPWKVRVICWVCGAYTEGKDAESAFKAWNETAYFGRFMELDHIKKTKS